MSQQKASNNLIWAAPLLLALGAALGWGANHFSQRPAAQAAASTAPAAQNTASTTASSTATATTTASTTATSATTTATPPSTTTSTTAASTTASPATAGDASAEATIRKAIEGAFGGRYKVAAVTATPLPTIYEVRINNDLVYVDSTGRYLFAQESMIDIKEEKNLTSLRMDEILRVKWEELPLNLALKQVIGNGKKQVAVFEDPNCGHCRNTRRALMQMTDVTIYTFTYPILAADSTLKVRQTLCAKDPMKAWNELMLEQKVPNNPGTCENKLDQIVQLGKKLGVTGTPTLIFRDGKRVPSGLSPERLTQLLATHSPA